MQRQRRLTVVRNGACDGSCTQGCDTCNTKDRCEGCDKNCDYLGGYCNEECGGKGNTACDESCNTDCQCSEGFGVTHDDDWRVRNGYCDACPYYQYSLGSTRTCRDKDTNQCDAGKRYQSTGTTAASQGECKECSEGYYQDDDGTRAQSCKVHDLVCAAGDQVAGNSTASNGDCEACPYNFYQSHSQTR